MKKLLALVLALVMTLGLATVGASAATVKYADKSDISYQEAADVLSSVGVFEGKGENFAPKDNLNRAEAAKLVAYLMLGNKTAEAIHGNGNRFSDVPADHWAVGYIEYLATAGVVSGVGDGKFNPNGQVTAVQFAKMLCVALGYDAQVEGYVGNSWNINIMKQANDDDIFKTLEVGSNDALTREQAAQMCLNALKANMVEYESKGDTLTINNSTVVLNAKKAKDKTTTATKGNAIKDDDAWGTTTNPYTLQLGEDLYNGDLKMEKTRDDFGRPANKWTYKMEKVGTYANIGDLKATYTDEIKNGPIYDLLGSSVYDHLVLGTAANNYAQLHYFEDGVGYGNTTDGWVNNSATASVNKTAVQYFVLKNGDKAINYNADGNGSTSSGRGSVTQVFVDKDDNVDIVVMNTYVFQAAGDYRSNTEDIVVSIPGDAGQQGNAYNTMSLNSYRLELNDFPQIKDLKKDDYLLITAYKDGNRYKVSSVDKAEKLTGKVDKVVIEDSVTIDGELKKYNKTATTKTKQNEFSVGQEATVVLDKYGYIVYVDEAVVASNYVFISELYQNGGNTSKVQANAYFSDGTNKTITVKEANKGAGKVSDRGALVTATSNAGMHKGVVGTEGKYAGDTAITDAVSDYAGWYTYSKNSADEYTLTAVKSSWKFENEFHNGTYAGTNGVLTKGDTVKFLSNTNPAIGNVLSSAGINAGSAKANSKTVMVVAYKDNTDVDVYTGVKNLPDITLGDGSTNTKGQGGAAVFSVLDGDGYARYVFVSLEGDYSVFGTESESLLYIVKYDKEHRISDNKNYYTYKALDENANEIVIEADSTFPGTSGVYEAFYKTNKNSDGRYTRALSVPTTRGAKYFATNGSVSDPITADGDTLTIANQGFTLASNSKIVYVSRVDELNKKDTLNDSGYEADIVTADGLAAFVKGYTVTYTVQAKLDDTYNGNGGKIIEAYVTITAATRTAGGSTTSSGNGILGMVLPNDLTTGDTIGVWYNGSTPTGDEVEAYLSDLLEQYNMTINKVTYGNTTSKPYTYELKSTKTGSVYQGALVYNSGKAAGSDAGNDGKLSAKDLNGTITSGDTVTNLVVMKGETLTISGGTLNVNNALIDGQLNISSGATLNITGTAYVTKDGDINNKGGSITGNKVDVLKGSTSLVSTGTINLAYLETAGHVDISGGNTTVTNTLTIDSGANLELSGTAVLNTFGGTVTVNGGDITIGGNATFTVPTAGLDLTNAASVTLASSTAVIDGNVKGTVTKSDNTVVKNDSFAPVTTAKPELTVTLSSVDALGIQSVTGMTLKTASDRNPVYVITADTVSITLENWTAQPFAGASVSCNSSGVYTTTTTSVGEIASKGITKINLKKGTGTGSSSLTIGQAG